MLSYQIIVKTYAFHKAESDAHGKDVIMYAKFNNTLVFQFKFHWIFVPECLLPDGTKPLPEPMMTNFSGVLWHSPEANFAANAQDLYPWYEFQNN